MTLDPGQIVCQKRCMLHFSEISTIAVDFRYTEVKTLSHCNEVENDVGDEMIHLLEAIMNTCSSAGINLNTIN